MNAKWRRCSCGWITERSFALYPMCVFFGIFWESKTLFLLPKLDQSFNSTFYVFANGVSWMFQPQGRKIICGFLITHNRLFLKNTTNSLTEKFVYLSQFQPKPGKKKKGEVNDLKWTLLSYNGYNVWNHFNSICNLFFFSALIRSQNWFSIFETFFFYFVRVFRLRIF